MQRQLSKQLTEDHAFPILHILFNNIRGIAFFYFFIERNERLIIQEFLKQNGHAFMIFLIYMYHFFLVSFYQMDVFEIEAVDLEDLTKVIVGHDATDAGSGWFLDKVIIKEITKHQKEWIFPCGRYVNDKIILGLCLTSFYSQFYQILFLAFRNNVVGNLDHVTKYFYTFIKNLIFPMEKENISS